MPRVNRDLQRRLAARRERERSERRRPTERRYRFASPDQALEAQDETDLATSSADESTAAVARPADSRTRTDGRGFARAPARTFAEYSADYAYVLRDLRRVALVVGSLLVILIVLYFVLPH